MLLSISVGWLVDVNANPPKNESQDAAGLLVSSLALLAQGSSWGGVKAIGE